mmetsp:Transcript_15917/g.44038  ORF Transcript_15917/g.44038 Transcript_15917/m.44038 type:complete len:83 (+) Transcript_15917:2681-2929(+)
MDPLRHSFVFRLDKYELYSYSAANKRLKSEVCKNGATKQTEQTNKQKQIPLLQYRTVRKDTAWLFAARSSVDAIAPDQMRML